MNKSETCKEQRNYVFFMMSWLRLAMIVLLSSILLRQLEPGSGWKWWFVVGTMALLAVNHLFYGYSRKKATILLQNAIDLAAAAGYCFFFPGSDFLQPLLFGIFGTTLLLQFSERRIIAAWSAAVCVIWIVSLIIQVQSGQNISVISNLVNLGFVLFACFVGYLIRFNQEARDKIADLYDELGESHEQLGRYAEEIESLAVTRERNRIAREIHDTIGHSLTALLVQLQGARKFQSSDPAKTSGLLQQSEDLARSALQEVRLSVRAIREDSRRTGPFSDSLRKLTSDFAEMTGMRIEFRETGMTAQIAEPLELAVYRVVQEALTNAQKHGGATQATIELDAAPENLTVRIKDNGVGTDRIEEGFGLLNMTERVKEHDGTIRYTSGKNNGFQIDAAFPLQTAG